MSCLDAADLAHAATCAPDDVNPHVRDCLACRRKVESDRALRATLRALPAPTLTIARRRELAAELIARAQFQPARRPRTIPMTRVVTGALATAAATLVIVAWPRPSERDTHHAVEIAVDSSGNELATRSTSVAFEEPGPNTTSAPSISAPDETPGALRHTSWRIRAQHTVVGAERSAVRDRVEHDRYWQTTAASSSLRALRDGWIALRDGHNLEAMQLFDRVTDEVAREEAAYWAAVAARRAGDPSANVRIATFHEMFPTSQLVFHDR